MNRREFLRRASIIAAGAIAADQLELLERLAPRRLYWPGADFVRVRTVVTTSDWDKLLRECYMEDAIASLIELETPFIRKIMPFTVVEPGHVGHLTARRRGVRFTIA